MAANTFNLANDEDGKDYHNFGSMVLILVYTFMNVCSFAIVIPTSKQYVGMLNGPDWVSGLSIGIIVIAAGFAGFGYKKVADRWGLKKGIVLSCVLSIIGAVMYALAGYAESLALLLIARIVQGFGSNTSMRLSYLGCSVATRKLTGIMSLEAASQSLAYAGGPLFAFFITLFTTLDRRLDEKNPNLDRTTDHYLLFNEGASAGWFMAAAWVVFMIVHCALFVEPDLKAGFSAKEMESDDEETERSGDLEAGGGKPKTQAPTFCSLKWSLLLPLQLSMFVMPMVFGAFEVLTVELSQIAPLNLPTAYSALYLAAIMFVCAGLTVTVKPLLHRQMLKQKQKQRQEQQQKLEAESATHHSASLSSGCFGPTLSDRNLVLGLYLVGTIMIGLVFTVILEPVYSRYTSKHKTGEPAWEALLLYIVLVSLICTALNIARAASTSLLAKPLLVPAEYRDLMAVITSFVYLVGRGVGPLIASAVPHWVMVLVLCIGCFVVFMVIGIVYPWLDASALESNTQISTATEVNRRASRKSVLRESMRESIRTSR